MRFVANATPLNKLNSLKVFIIWPKGVILGGWGSRPPDFGLGVVGVAGCRGQIEKYYFLYVIILSCTVGRPKGKFCLGNRKKGNLGVNDFKKVIGNRS